VAAIADTLERLVLAIPEGMSDEELERQIKAWRA
jgi:hypothetical protein